MNTEHQIQIDHQNNEIIVGDNHYKLVGNYLRSKFPGASRDAIYDATHFGISEWYTSAPEHVHLCQKKSRGWMIQVAQRALAREIKRTQKFEGIYHQEADDDKKNSVTVTDLLKYDGSVTIVGSLTIEKLFSDLTPTIAEAIRLHVIEDYTVDEVAQQQRCSRDAVKKRLKQGYARMREMVRSDECSW